MREILSRSRGVIVAAFLLVIVAMLLAACDDRADPGNERLEALENDPALDLRPAGTSTGGPSSSTASGFSLFVEEKQGPSVTQLYRVEGDSEAVLDFFRAELPRLGWEFDKATPVGNPVQRFPVYVFRKDINDWIATLIVDHHEPPPNGSGPPVVAIVLSAPPVVRR